MQHPTAGIKTFNTAECSEYLLGGAIAQAAYVNHVVIMLKIYHILVSFLLQSVLSLVKLKLRGKDLGMGVLDPVPGTATGLL